MAVPMTLLAARAALDAGTWSAEGLTEWALERARATAPLNAFVRIEEAQALKSARAADRRRAALTDDTRHRVPALNGIPLAHKDLFYRAAGAPGCASRAPAPPLPGVDATVLMLLDRAGAVDLGVLHLSEYAYGPTGLNDAIGPARNPWNSAHVTGGSSSGSAAAVAAGAAYASLGSDSGGSIRTPASWCGLTGLKPTRGAISLAGAMALAPTMDTVGILARSAADVARLLAVVAGPDPADPRTAGAPAWDGTACERAMSAGIRLGVVDDWFHEGLDDAIAAGIDQAREDWAQRLGARIVAAQLPDLPGVVRHARAVLLREAWDVHRPLIEQHDALYSPAVLSRLLAGQEIDEAEYRGALAELPQRLQAAIDSAFRDADVLLLPCNPTTAPRIDAMAVPPGAAVLAQVDAINRCLRPFNYLGLPSLVLPAGIGSGGLPFGFQLVARPFEEGRLLALGMRWQAATDWHRQHPPGWEMA